MRAERYAIDGKRKGYLGPAVIAKPEVRKADVARELVAHRNVGKRQREQSARRRIGPKAAPRTVMLIFDNRRAHEIALGRAARKALPRHSGRCQQATRRRRRAAAIATNGDLAARAALRDR